LMYPLVVYFDCYVIYALAHFVDRLAYEERQGVWAQAWRKIYAWSLLELDSSYRGCVLVHVCRLWFR
jgi:hypothetical protein